LRDAEHRCRCPYPSDAEHQPVEQPLGDEIRMTLDPELWWGGLFNLAGDPRRAAATSA
jgi:hypothetical protein